MEEVVVAPLRPRKTTATGVEEAVAVEGTRVTVMVIDSLGTSMSSKNKRVRMRNELDAHKELIDFPSSLVIFLLPVLFVHTPLPSFLLRLDSASIENPFPVHLDDVPRAVPPFVFTLRAKRNAEGLFFFVFYKYVASIIPKPTNNEVKVYFPFFNN